MTTARCRLMVDLKNFGQSNPGLIAAEPDCYQIDPSTARLSTTTFRINIDTNGHICFDVLNNNSAVSQS
jgi:hypothetical protein